jgi:hypothetical protein
VTKLRLTFLGIDQAFAFCGRDEDGREFMEFDLDRKQVDGTTPLLLLYTEGSNVYRETARTLTVGRLGGLRLTR